MRLGWARQALIVLVAAGVAFVGVSRFGSSERLEARLRSASEADLARILSGLTTEADLLRDEISTLRLQLRDLETSTERGEAAAQAASARLEALSVLAGTVPVTGPGVLVTVADPNGVVGYEDLLDAVQELRDAGAEALAVNGLRVGTAGAFSGEEGRVLLDGRPLKAPYRLEAIGDPGTLEGGLEIPGGVIDSLTSQPRVSVTVGRRSTLELPALLRHPSFQVAEPVDTEG